MIRPTPSSTRSDPLFPYPTLFRSFLQLSAAVRYERYEGLADVASPKLGLVYRPIPSITIKGGWGKSFKAPTFYQRYKVYRSEEHTSELQSLMRISYAVFCLKKKKKHK